MATPNAKDHVLIVRKARRSDIENIVALHKESFPDYFLTSLGSSFLGLFYDEFLRDERHCCYVACYDADLVGLVAGSQNTDILYKGLYRRHFLRLVRIVSFRLLTSSTTRTHFRRRLGHVGTALRAVLGGHTEEREPVSSVHSGTILSLAVSAVARGKGVAQELTQASFDYFSERKCTTITLSVVPSNSRAIRFYEKDGWIRISESTEHVSYSKTLST